jgi:hypothetical protein
MLKIFSGEEIWTVFSGGAFRFISRLTEEGLLSRDKAMERIDWPCSKAIAISIQGELQG